MNAQETSRDNKIHPEQAVDEKSSDRQVPPDLIDDSVLGTSKIDPNDFGATDRNPDRISSMKYAIAGLIYMFRREQSVKLLVATTAALIVILLWLNINRTDAALVLLSIGLVWMTEFLNSAVEAVVDLTTDEIHPLAKVAKDVGAAASLVGSLLTLVIVIMIIGPALLARL